MNGLLKIIVTLVLVYVVVMGIAALPHFDVPTDAQPNANGLYEVRPTADITGPAVVLIVIVSIAVLNKRS